MKKLTIITTALVPALILSSCLGEVQEKYEQAKQGASSISGIIAEAENMDERISQLEDAVPITNEQFKAWLPETIGRLERTGFAVGQAGVAGVSSVEGTYQANEGERAVQVMMFDGAGPAGVGMAMGAGLINGIEIEREDENEHQQTVTQNGIKAQQVYYKKSNSTELAFSYQNRFFTIISATDMDPEATWAVVEELDWDGLIDLAGE